MTPNIVDGPFLLAQTSIAKDTATTTTTTMTTTITTPITSTTSVKLEPLSSSLSLSSTTTTATARMMTPKHAINNDRVPHQGENAASVASGTLTATQPEAKKPFKMEIVWFNVGLFILLHSMAFYGLWLVFARSAYLEFLLAYLITILGGMGVTVGVHRLWSHRSYKAKMPLRIFLMLMQSLAFQNSIYEWSRDHRIHHKFTDTDADPHNSRRGFFFAHMGWLMCRKHPDVKAKGQHVDLSDLMADPVVAFQRKYYGIIMPICCFLIPTAMPYYCFGCSLNTSFFICSMLRYTLMLHGTWLVNSAAHFYGMKPYDIKVSARNNKTVAAITYGEGWHNFHHVFPWDYKAAELGTYKHNWSTAFINLMAKIGQAYDLKTVSEAIVLKRVRRTGDGTHASIVEHNNNAGDGVGVGAEAGVGGGGITDELVAHLNHENELCAVWGWDDKDISPDDRRGAAILGRKYD